MEKMLSAFFQCPLARPSSFSSSSTSLSELQLQARRTSPATHVRASPGTRRRANIRLPRVKTGGREEAKSRKNVTQGFLDEMNN